MIKVTRAADAPPSLAGKSKYDGRDVKKQLRHDFYTKCYLCETNVKKGYEVEHLRAKAVHEDLKFEWTNLFLVCRNCNGIKSDRFPDTIIDCCREDPETMLIQRVHNGKLIIEARKLSDPAKQKMAEDTAKLLHECFYGRRPQKGGDWNAALRQADKCAALRAEVKEQIIELCNLLCDYRKLRDQKADTRAQYKKISSMLSPAAEYAAFTRSFVRERPDLFPEFQEQVKIDIDTSGCDGTV